MTPILAAHIPFLKKFDAPIDNHAHFRNKRILGDHKTWRGLITGVAAGTIASALLGLGPIYGILVSLGALGGDAAKSFFKRQANVPSGKSWFPFDQVDFIIGGLLLATFTGQTNPTAGIQPTIFIIYFLLHIISSFVGYILKLKDRPI